MPRGKKIEDQPLEKLLELLDAQVAARGQAVLAELDATAEIARIASEARRRGATMTEIAGHVQRMDKKTRKLTPVTRQALDVMLATHEERREPRTTRASRRRRNAEPTAAKPAELEAISHATPRNVSAPAGTLNAEAFG